MPIAQGKLGYRGSDILVALRNTTNDTPEAIYSDDGKLHVLPYYWNPDTLAYEVSTGGTAPGGNVNVTNFPGTQPVSAASLPLPTGAATEATLDAILAATGGSAYSSRYDEGATYTYIGLADAGSAEGSAVWQVKRMTNTSLTIVFADGNTNFDNVWANRASLSYS